MEWNLTTRFIHSMVHYPVFIIKKKDSSSHSVLMNPPIRSKVLSILKNVDNETIVYKENIGKRYVVTNYKGDFH